MNGNLFGTSSRSVKKTFRYTSTHVELYVSVPFSVRSLLKESVLERPGSEMTFEPSLTVRLMDW